MMDPEILHGEHYLQIIWNWSLFQPIVIAESIQGTNLAASDSEQLMRKCGITYQSIVILCTKEMAC